MVEEVRNPFKIRSRIFTEPPSQIQGPVPMLPPPEVPPAPPSYYLPDDDGDLELVIVPRWDPMGLTFAEVVENLTRLSRRFHEWYCLTCARFEDEPPARCCREIVRSREVSKVIRGIRGELFGYVTLKNEWRPATTWVRV